MVLGLIAIYLYTKFDLNGNSSFKVIWRTRYRDGQTDKIAATIMLPPSGGLKMGFKCSKKLMKINIHVSVDS